MGMTIAEKILARKGGRDVVRDMLNAMQVLKDEVIEKNRVVDRPDLLASFDKLNELMGFDTLDELEQRFAA
jgi:hypothetical protein